MKVTVFIVYKELLCSSLKISAGSYNNLCGGPEYERTDVPKNAENSSTQTQVSYIEKE